MQAILLTKFEWGSKQAMRNCWAHWSIDIILFLNYSLVLGALGNKEFANLVDELGKKKWNRRSDQEKRLRHLEPDKICVNNCSI